MISSMAKAADSKNVNGFPLEIKGILSLLKLISFTVLAALLTILFARPYIANSDINHASFAEFNFSTPTTTNNNMSATILHYKLNLGIAVENPNENHGIYYDNVQVLAYYKKQRFGMANLSSFYQGKKNTTEMTLWLKGQQLMIFDGIEDLRKLKHCDVGVGYDIVVELYRRNKYQSISGTLITRLIWPSWQDKSKMTCYLEVPLIGGYKNSEPAQSAMCYEDHFDDELYFHFVFLCLLEFHLVILALALSLILAEAQEQRLQSTAIELYFDDGFSLIVECE